MKPVQSGIARSYQGNGRLKTIAARVKSVADVIATTKKASGTECKLIAVGPVIASWRTNFGSNIPQATQPSTQVVPTAALLGPRRGRHAKGSVNLGGRKRTRARERSWEMTVAKQEHAQGSQK
jgi:hypothetical protein